MTSPEWNYSGDPSASLRDEVRFLLQDTEPTLPLLSDLELDYLIKYWMPRYESAYMVASHAAGVIARKFAGLVSVSADGVSVQVGDVSAKYTELAKTLKQAHTEAMDVGGEVSIENILNDYELDPSIAPLNFAVGGMDNPEAGHQAVGGRSVYRGPDWVDGGWRP